MYSRFKRLIALSVMATVITFIGCFDNDAGDTGPTRPDDQFGEFIPMAVGNYWIYELSTYMGDMLYEQETDTMVIDTLFQYNNHVWYGNRGSSEFERNGDEGVWTIFWNDSAFSEPVLLYPYPAIAGQKWTISDSDTMEFEYTVESTNASVTTAYGTWNGCYRLRLDYKNGDLPPFSEWIKPGIGRIKLSYEGEEMGISFKIELLLVDYYLHE